MCVSTAATSCAASSLLTLSDSSELVLSYRFCQLDLVAFEFESKALSCWVANRIGRASTRGCVLSLRAWPLRSTHALRRRAGERENSLSVSPNFIMCVPSLSWQITVAFHEHTQKSVIGWFRRDCHMVSSDDRAMLYFQRTEVRNTFLSHLPYQYENITIVCQASLGTNRATGMTIEL